MRGNEKRYHSELAVLEREGNLRELPVVSYEGKWVWKEGKRMLNLSSNDYLGLSADGYLREQFMKQLDERDFMFSASSSRLLTGNVPAYHNLEALLAGLYHAEDALVLGSGYHMNTGILPAVADSHTLILADKLVHASLIDGIRLSAARCIRFRHQDLDQLEQLLERYAPEYSQVIVVTESIFSMDGDVTDLSRLVALKRDYPQLMLYVDEAHAVGVRGAGGLGIAQEQGCAGGIDFLCGTFGKALASVGAFVVCSRVMKAYLVNKMRTLIFTTALPPLNVAWTHFIMEHLSSWQERRNHLHHISEILQERMRENGYPTPSGSHIVPLTVGASGRAVELALRLQNSGFYVLPVRPPAVPPGTSRLRFSLTASLTDAELADLLKCVIPDPVFPGGI